MNSTLHFRFIILTICLIITSPIFAVDMNCPPNVLVECYEDVLTEYDYTSFINAGGTASDTVHGIDEGSFVATDDETLENCTTTVVRRYEISNNAAESGSCDHIILVVDLTPPTGLCIDSISQEEDPGSLGSATVSIDMPELSDNCSGVLTLTNDFNDSDDASDEYSIGETDVVWSIIDECENIGTCTTKVIITKIVNPEITCPNDISIECLTDAPMAYNTWSEFTSAGGTLDNNVVLNESSFEIGNEVEDGDDCSGLITRTYYVEDENGNSVNCEHKINAEDQTIPEFTFCPANVAVSTAQSGDLDAVVSTISSPDGTDNCGENFSFAYSIDGGDFENGGNANGTFDLGETEITWKVIDACGNENTNCVTTVTVLDQSIPEITCPPQMTISCFADLPETISASAEFTAAGGMLTDDDNNIDTTTFIGSEGTPPSDNCDKQYIRTYEIADTDGNFVSCEHIFNIQDNISPVIDPIDDIAVDNIEDVPNPNPDILSYSDNCGGLVTAEHVNDVTDSSLCLSIIRTYIVTDACDNETMITQTITIDCSTNILFNGYNPISIYPNPFSSHVILEGDLSTLDKVEIIDISGKIQITHNSDFSVINTESLMPGLYFVRIYQNDLSETLKLIKQ